MSDVASEKEFEDQVVTRSAALPVVVDFWAPWCAPCRALTPALEREVAALDGRVELVKVNIDDHPALASAFDVRAIPAVKAFRGGEVIASFEGARDASFVRRWLAELSPSPGRQALERAAAARRSGDLSAAEAELAPLVEDPEVGPAAAVTLAELLLHAGRGDEAGPLLSRVPPRAPEADRAAALEAVVELSRRSPTAARGAWPEALEELFAVVADRRPEKEQALADLRAIFELLGPESDLVRDVRRRLQIVT
jgi:putative thioredoxin